MVNDYENSHIPKMVNRLSMVNDGMIIYGMVIGYIMIVNDG